MRAGGTRRSTCGFWIVALIVGGVCEARMVRSVHAQVPAPQKSDPPSRSVWSGVYTTGQADRGKKEYDLSCLSCHGPDLRGADGPALVGDEFLRNWLEDDVRSLVDKVHARMPADAPGSLSVSESIDTVSYLLQVNGFPPGSGELPSDVAALSAIRIEGKNGPAPVPNFSLVLVVGCLTQTDTQWLVTRGTDPMRTRDSAPTVGTGALASAPLGTQTFRLMDVTSARPENYKGNKVEVKGLLMRQPAGTLLNVTSIQAIASSCS
jgi:hypothetical protein